jgi:hypothetical protein
VIPHPAVEIARNVRETAGAAARQTKTQTNGPTPADRSVIGPRYDRVVGARVRPSTFLDTW